MEITKQISIGSAKHIFFLFLCIQVFFIDHKNELTTFLDPRLPLPDTPYTFVGTSNETEIRPPEATAPPAVRAHHTTVVHQSQSVDSQDQSVTPTPATPIPSTPTPTPSTPTPTPSTVTPTPSTPTPTTPTPSTPTPVVQTSEGSGGLAVPSDPSNRASVVSDASLNVTRLSK